VHEALRRLGEDAVCGVNLTGARGADRACLGLWIRCLDGHVELQMLIGFHAGMAVTAYAMVSVVSRRECSGGNT